MVALALVKRLLEGRRPWVEIPLLVACIPAGILVYRLLAIFWTRLWFPMDIEWMEGGVLLHAQRYLEGLTVYTGDQAGFRPFPYPPFQFVLLALFGSVFPLDYALGRSLSVAAALGAAALLAREVYRQFSNAPLPGAWAALSVGTMAAAYPVIGGWYDLVRNDSLAAALVISAAVVALDGPDASRARRVALGALLVASLFTKQTCAFFVAWVLVFAIREHPRRGLLLVAGTVLAATAVFAFAYHRTSGRYWSYTVAQMARQWVFPRLMLRGAALVLEFAPFVAALPFLAVGLALKKRLSRRSVFWLGMLLAAVPASLLPFAKIGGFDNNLMSLCLLVGPVTLCVVSDALEIVRPSARAKASSAVALGMACFLMLRFFDRATFEPTPSDRARAKGLNAYVRKLDGPVLIPNHPFLAVRNGHDVEQFHTMAWGDAEYAGMQLPDFSAFIRSSGASYAIISGYEPKAIHAGLDREMVPKEMLPSHLRWLVNRIGAPSSLVALLGRPVHREQEHCVFDFERGAFEGWERSGDAFGKRPAKKSEGMWGVRGERLANSLHAKHGGMRTGSLVSPPFDVDRARIGLRVGGTKSRARVELRIDDEVVHTAAGESSDVLLERIWDVAAWKGRSARLALVDEDRAWSGYLLVDDVCLFEP